jgi:hypothetical protein
MGEFALNDVHARNAGVDNEIESITSNTTLSAYQHYVYATIPGSGTLTITLPPLAECIGKGPYLIRVDSDGGGTGLVVQDDDEGDPAYQSSNMGDVDDYVLVQATPNCWVELSSQTD